jgi:hypothetical protein
VQYVKHALLLQVLYAHIFGVLLLDEQESLWGILGSMLIATGVVTVNSSKSSQGCAETERVPPLPVYEYHPVGSSEEAAPRLPPLWSPSDLPVRGGLGMSAPQEEAVMLGSPIAGPTYVDAPLGDAPKLPSVRSGHDFIELGRVASAGRGHEDHARHVNSCSILVDTVPGVMSGHNSPIGQVDAHNNRDGARSSGTEPLCGGEALSGAAPDEERRGVSMRRQRRTAGVGAPLREREVSWNGAWLFDRQSSDLAPFMTKYRSLLQDDRDTADHPQ